MTRRIARRPVGLAAIVAASALAVAACASSSSTQSPSASANTGSLPKANGSLNGAITLGAVIPLTGDNATTGMDQQRGIQLAVANINSKDGVLGKKLVVDVQDSAGQADSAIQAASKLINVDKAPVVIGEYSSGNTIPLEQYLQQHGVVGINPGSSSVKLRGIGSLQFSSIGLDDVAGKFAATALHSKGYKKIAILAPDNAYGSGIVAAVSSAFAQLGGKVAASELYTEGQSGYLTELNRLQSADPDVYVVTMYGKDGTTINSEMYQLGMTKKPVFDIYPSEDVPETNPTAVEGRTGIDLTAIAGTPQALAYHAEYQKAFGGDFISPFNGLAYDAVELAAAAIDKAGSTSPTAIAAALHQVASPSARYAGVTGPVAFDMQNSRIAQTYVYVTIHNGKEVVQSQ